MTTHRKDLWVACFPEFVPGTDTLRLAAAVLCRGVPTPEARYGVGPIGWLRGIRQRLWLRFGPLGLDVTVAGRPLFGGALGATSSCSAWAPHSEPIEYNDNSEPIAYYDNWSHVLRVLGRVVAAPPRRTLVALVDASGSRAAAPHVALRVVSTPNVPVGPLEPVPPAADAGPPAYIVVGQHPLWDAALRDDPVIRAFVDATMPIGGASVG